jgi:hypothetical protein
LHEFKILCQRTPIGATSDDSWDQPDFWPFFSVLGVKPRALHILVRQVVKNI